MPPKNFSAHFVSLTDPRKNNHNKHHKLVKQEKTAKVGLKIKRSKAGWNHQYLAKFLRVD